MSRGAMLLAALTAMLPTVGRPGPLFVKERSGEKQAPLGTLDHHRRATKAELARARARGRLRR
jgi:hypothetical protein